MLFLTVLSCLYDYATVRVGGGSATDLLRIYRIEGVRRFMAFVIPAGLAVLAVASQLASGGGSEFVESVISLLPQIGVPPAR